MVEQRGTVRQRESGKKKQEQRRQKQTRGGDASPRLRVFYRYAKIAKPVGSSRQRPGFSARLLLMSVVRPKSLSQHA